MVTAVQQERTRLSSARQHAAQPPDSKQISKNQQQQTSSRWGASKDTSVVPRTHTARANPP
jgi:hypothetical protein